MIRAGVQAGAYWMLSPDEVRACNRRTSRPLSAARPHVPVWLSPIVCPPSPNNVPAEAKYCPCKPI